MARHQRPGALPAAPAVSPEPEPEVEVVVEVTLATAPAPSPVVRTLADAIVRAAARGTVVPPPAYLGISKEDIAEAARLADAESGGA